MLISGHGVQNLLFNEPLDKVLKGRFFPFYPYHRLFGHLFKAKPGHLIRAETAYDRNRIAHISQLCAVISK